METNQIEMITIEATVNAPIEKVWQYWTMPEHVTGWCFASGDWCCPRAENDLRPGGKFLTRMEAKDGSMGFDFDGVYDTVNPNELIEYSLADGRKVSITFRSEGDTTIVTEKFNPENENPKEMQQMGWQAILNNFKSYAESL